MYPHTALIIFGIVSLTGLAFLGTITEELAFKDKASQAVPAPPPLILPDSGNPHESQEFKAARSGESLPDGLTRMANDSTPVSGIVTR